MSGFGDMAHELLEENAMLRAERDTLAELARDLTAALAGQSRKLAKVDDVACELLDALKALVRRREEACAEVNYKPVDGSDRRYARARRVIAMAEEVLL